MMKKLSMKTILNIIIEKKTTLFYGQIIAIIATLISVPIPLMLPVMVDEVLLNKPGIFVLSINSILGSSSAFIYILIVTFSVVFLRFTYYFLTVISTKFFIKISKHVTFIIRKNLIEHLRYVSMDEYETLGRGVITANLITDVNTLETFIITAVSKLFSSVLTIFAVGIVMINIEPILGFFILLIQPIIMILSKKMSKIVGIFKAEENAAISTFQENIGEILELFGQIKASNKEDYFFSNATNLAKNIQKASNNHSFKNVAYEKFSYTIFLVMFELIRASGLLLVAYSDLSIGMMFALFGYIWFIMTPVKDILSFQYSYSSAKAAIERLNNILTLKIEESGKELLSERNIDILVKNVNFSYKNGKNILKNINLNIRSGSKIAIIGASGSGKTTLAQVIAGFYKKDNGSIYFNNKEIQKLNKISLRKKIFLVLQMPILFNSTLRFNITMGNKNISDEKIYKALKIAQLEEMLVEMNDGLETVVGHHGIRLSGGQRQRLSIVRMIIAEPNIVIFDESTSALDVHTESILQSELQHILKDKTVITISHRLSTVKSADIIYVLEDGKIVQNGSHKDLENEDGHYREFIKQH